MKRVSCSYRRRCPGKEFENNRTAKMLSLLKSDTARANGAKSRGSNSAATREISSRNCLPGGPAPSSCAKTSRFPWHACRVRHLPARHPEEHTLVKERVAPGGIERLWT